MAFIKRQKEVEIFGNKFLLTTWSIQDKDNHERKFGISAMSLEMAMIGEKLNAPKISTEERAKLNQRKEEIIKSMELIDTDVNCELIDFFTRNTPDRPSMDEIKSDATLFNILLIEVLRFKNGNEYYETTLIGKLRSELMRSKEQNITTSEVLKLIADIEQDILSGNYKKKE